MIDAGSLAVSALWILGLGLGLASASFVYWLPSSRRAAASEPQTSRHVRVALGGAGVLFSIGWGASSSEIWERLVLSLLAVVLAIQLWREWKGR
jgi:hypothetical protein